MDRHRDDPFEYDFDDDDFMDEPISSLPYGAVRSSKLSRRLEEARRPRPLRRFQKENPLATFKKCTVCQSAFRGMGELCSLCRREYSDYRQYKSPSCSVCAEPMRTGLLQYVEGKGAVCIKCRMGRNPLATRQWVWRSPTIEVVSWKKDGLGFCVIYSGRDITEDAVQRELYKNGFRCTVKTWERSDPLTMSRQAWTCKMAKAPRAGWVGERLPGNPPLLSNRGHKRNPVPKGAVEIYDRILAIEAVKGNKGEFPKEHFRHDFTGHAKIYGKPDGSLVVTPKNRSKLWKEFNYA